ncbi:hypothetical protein THERMOT_1297 [Bathymodiolus thermophilus thioautotrophic gill symbiont]|nr:hypothetical protein THERMOT_1297 [Bathymodiolus thermophilus thioautotrophic gill symbiont]
MKACLCGFCASFPSSSWECVVGFEDKNMTKRLGRVFE